MGQCVKTTFSYGFIIQEADIEKLLTALGKENVKDSFDAANPDTWFGFINSWLNREDTEPFCFTSVNNCYEPEMAKKPGDREEDSEFKAELAVSFVGRDDIEYDTPKYDMELWGRENFGTKVIPILEPWVDEEFMNNANEAFEKLNNTTAFKTAGITITPRWLLELNFG